MHNKSETLKDPELFLKASVTFYLRKQTHRLWDWTRRLRKDGPDSQSSGQPVSAG